MKYEFIFYFFSKWIYTYVYLTQKLTFKVLGFKKKTKTRMTNE